MHHHEVSAGRDRARQPQCRQRAVREVHRDQHGAIFGRRRALDHQHRPGEAADEPLRRRAQDQVPQHAAAARAEHQHVRRGCARHLLDGPQEAAGQDLRVRADAVAVPQRGSQGVQQHLRLLAHAFGQVRREIGDQPPQLVEAREGRDVHEFQRRARRARDAGGALGRVAGRGGQVGRGEQPLQAGHGDPPWRGGSPRCDGRGARDRKAGELHGSPGVSGRAIGSNNDPHHVKVVL